MKINAAFVSQFPTQSALQSIQSRQKTTIQSRQAATALTKQRQDTLLIQNKLRALKKAPLEQEKKVEEQNTKQSALAALRGILQHCGSDIPEVSAAAQRFLDSITTPTAPGNPLRIEGNLTNGSQLGEIGLGDPVHIVIRDEMVFTKEEAREKLDNPQYWLDGTITNYDPVNGLTWEQDLDAAIRGLHTYGQADISGTADLVAARYVAIRDRVLRDFSGQEQQDALARLDELASAKIQQMAREYAQKLENSFGESGVLVDAKEIESSILMAVDHRTKEYLHLYQSNPNYAGISGPEENWLLNDSEYMASELRKAMKAAGGSQPQALEGLNPNAAPYTSEELSKLSDIAAQMGQCIRDGKIQKAAELMAGQYTLQRERILRNTPEAERQAALSRLDAQQNAASQLLADKLGTKLGAFFRENGLDLDNQEITQSVLAATQNKILQAHPDADLKGTATAPYTARDLESLQTWVQEFQDYEQKRGFSPSSLNSEEAIGVYLAEMALKCQVFKDHAGVSGKVQELVDRYLDDYTTEFLEQVETELKENIQSIEDDLQWAMEMGVYSKRQAEQKMAEARNRFSSLDRSAVYSVIENTLSAYRDTGSAGKALMKGVATAYGAYVQKSYDSRYAGVGRYDSNNLWLRDYFDNTPTSTWNEDTPPTSNIQRQIDDWNAFLTKISPNAPQSELLMDYAQFI